MIRTIASVAGSILLYSLPLYARPGFPSDTINTSGGDLEITFIGHGTLMMKYAGTTIHVDPWTKLADYTKLPKADLILITHHHQDHLDPNAIEQVSTDRTIILLTQKAADELKKGTVMKNGDAQAVLGIEVEAVPAYNIVHRRPDGNVFHPKGEGNGYVLTIGGTRLYIAGDTEGTPEMNALKDIDVAFLPMNLPYTMTPDMVAEAVRAFKPKILYPYHTGETDTAKLLELLNGKNGIEVRVRPMK
jgi:L-ascorbate metabolism protein UlaG (beta-lactamase superfamily)